MCEEIAYTKDISHRTFAAREAGMKLHLSGSTTSRAIISVSLFILIAAQVFGGFVRRTWVTTEEGIEDRKLAGKAFEVGSGPWLRAGDLRSGDALLTVSGEALIVVGVGLEATGTLLIDIQLEGRYQLAIGEGAFLVTDETLVPEEPFFLPEPDFSDDSMGCFPAGTPIVTPTGIVVHNKGSAEGPATSGGEGDFLDEVPMASDPVAEPLPEGMAAAADDQSRSAAAKQEPVSTDRPVSKMPDQVFLSTDDSNSTTSPVIVRSIIASGRYVPPEVVRTYEFYNYYSFGYPAAAPGELGVYANLRDEGNSRYSMQAVLRSPDQTLDNLPPLNVVFLLDVSGSMGSFQTTLRISILESWRHIGSLKGCSDTQGLLASFL